MNESIRGERAHLSSAARLRNLRRVLGFSVRELADEFGVSPGAVTLWEKEKRSIPGPVFRLLELYEARLGGGDSSQSAERTRRLGSRLTKQLLSAIGADRRGFDPKLRRSVEKAFAALAEESRSMDQISRRVQLAIARQVVRAVAESKGLPMKAIQLASFLRFGLSEDVRQALALVQAGGSPMSAGTVARIIHEDFGKQSKTLFAEWGSKPIAVASIGQVHRARLHSGELVAVKVQYPHIREKIQSHLKALSFLDRLIPLIQPVAPGILEEFRRRILEECDYQAEAENCERFHKIFEGDPDIVIPKVFRSHSSKRVLTLEFIQGRSFSEFVATATQAEKDRAGSAIARAHSEAIFRNFVMHADPHQGNYLFPRGKVALIDFGRVQPLDPEALRVEMRFYAAVLKGNLDEAKSVLLSARLVRDPNSFDFDEFIDYFSKSNRHLLSGKPFRFTPEYLAELSEASKGFRGRKGLLIDSTLFWGMLINLSVYSALADLRATANWKSIAAEFIFGF